MVSTSSCRSLPCLQKCALLEFLSIIFFGIFFSKIQIQTHFKKLLGSKVNVPMIETVPAIVSYVLRISILLQIKYTLAMTGSVLVILIKDKILTGFKI